MANLLPNVVYSQVPAKIRPVAGDDRFLIAQPWASGLEGYKTVNITIANLYTTVMNSIKTDGIGALVNLDTVNGLTGNGSTASPLGIDTVYLKNNYARPELVNASQIGNIERTGLPISGSYYSIAYPADGENREGVVAESSDGEITFINPVTNGSDIRYCYGKGRFGLTSSTFTFEQTDQVYKPPLSGIYASPDYFVDHVFSRTESAMLVRLKHVESNAADRSRDRLLWIDTNGSLESAYHTAYFVDVANFYNTENSGGVNPYSAANYFKYGIFEQNGKRYLIHRYTVVGQTNVGGLTDTGSKVRFYELNVDPNDRTKLISTLVTGITSTFLGKTWSAAENADYVNLNAGTPPKNTDPKPNGHWAYIDDPDDVFTSTGLTAGSRFTFLTQTMVVDGLVYLIHMRALSITAPRLDIAGTFTSRALPVWIYRINMTNKTVTHIKPSSVPSDNYPVFSRDGGSLVGINVVNVSNFGLNAYNASGIFHPPNLLLNGSTTIDAITDLRKFSQTPSQIVGDIFRFNNSVQTMSGLSARSASPTSIDLGMEFYPLDTTNIRNNTIYLTVNNGNSSSNLDPVGGIRLKVGDLQNVTHYSADGTQVTGYSLGVDRLPKGFKNNGWTRGQVTHFNAMTGQIFGGVTSGLTNTKCTTVFERFKVSTMAEFDAGDIMTTDSIKVTLTFDDPAGYSETTITKNLNWTILKNWLKSKQPVYRSAAAAVTLFYFKGSWWGWVEAVMIAPVGGLHQTHRVLCSVSRASDTEYSIAAIHDGSTAEPDSSVMYTFQDSANQQAYVGDGSWPRITIFTEESTGAIRVACVGGWYGGSSYVTPYRVYSYRCPEISGTVAEYASPTGGNNSEANWTVDKILGICVIRYTIWYGIPFTLHPVSFGAASGTTSNAIEDIRLLTAPYTADNFTVKITAPIPYFFAGLNGFIQPQDIDLRDWFPYVESRIFYMYLTLEAGQAKIEMRDSVTVERVNYTLIAVVSTDQNKISNIDAYSYMRLSNYRFSIVPRGASIPVSAPTADLDNFTSWE